MKCPYCGEEMDRGIIQSPQEIAWLDLNKRPLLGRAFLHEGSVVLSELSFLKGSAVWAYHCRACRKIVIDYSEGMQDYYQNR